MAYEYRKNAINSKTLQAKKQSGLPKNINLDFSSIHIRVYKAEGYQGYFNCSLAIPSLQDDEEYVLELPFIDSNASVSSAVMSLRRRMLIFLKVSLLMGYLIANFKI